jgi:hypothetical protein
VCGGLLSVCVGPFKNERGKEDEEAPLHHFELRIWSTDGSEVRGDGGKRSGTMSCGLVAIFQCRRNICLERVHSSDVCLIK